MAEKKSSALAEAYDWIQCFIVALACSILIFVFIGRVIGVVGTSMVPTLEPSDRVAMSNLFYTPERGDIVVLTKKSFDDRPIVKRVIATEGQTVDMDFTTGEVWVDGELLDEPYINEQMSRHYDVVFPVVVDEGCVFVMGDNRNVSLDSRRSDVGMIDERCILGRVYAVITPLSRFKLVR